MIIFLCFTSGVFVLLVFVFLLDKRKSSLGDFERGKIFFFFFSSIMFLILSEEDLKFESFSRDRETLGFLQDSFGDENYIVVIFMMVYII